MTPSSSSSSSSPLATTTTSSSPILPVKTISELSAATGLPSSEIQSWAASLPAGSTVRVTHHFDVKKAALAAAAASTRGCSGNPPNHMDFIRHLPQHPAALVNLPISPTAAATSAALTAAAITAATAAATDAGLPHEYLMPTDLESFAVDPNEVLKKDCGVSIKEEPLEEASPPAAFPLQPGMFGGDGSTYDMSLQGHIKSEPNSPMSSSSSSLVSLVSQYGGGGNASDVSDCGANGTLYDQSSSSAVAAPSRVLLPHFQRPQHGLPRGGGGGQQLEGGDVLDLVMPPVDYEAMEEDIDLTGVHLNEQDFHSIKSIVEQTFRDGRDMLDIIEAV